jgi:hypothetical protein
MTRADWERFRSHEGRLIEMELERLPRGTMAEQASGIAALAAKCSVNTEQIEVWPQSATQRPGPLSVQEYLILEKLPRRINLPKFTKRASTQDTPQLRKHLRDHVFLVKARADERRWEPKTQARERIVFMII